MGLKYSQIPIDTFEKIVMNAGIMCKNFDLVTKEASNLIAATTGGLQVVCTPEFTDFGDDIDNCPKNMKELKKINSYEVTASGTMVTVDVSGAKMLVGAADVDGGKITPRFELKDADFNDVWIVSDYSDENTGANAGYLAIHILNALNTGGFSLQTTDKGKGQLAFTLTGHVSMNAQDTVPIEIYIGGGASDVPYITLDRHSMNIDVDEEVQLTYEVNPSSATVSFASSASGKASVTNAGKVKGLEAGSTIITASITDSGVTYSDTCTVIVDSEG